MLYTTKETQEISWEYLKKYISGAKVGDELTINGCMWRVLETKEDRILVWKHTGLKRHIFNCSCSNIYEGSDIQRYLRGGFKEDLPAEMLEMVGEEGFFLLTEEQIRKYMPTGVERVATDEVGNATWWWTASQDIGRAYGVRVVYGGVTGYSSANSVGWVAPACWLIGNLE